MGKMLTKQAAGMIPAEEELIPLTRVAGLLGMSVSPLVEEAEAAGTLRFDWRGERAVEVSIAERMLSSRREAAARHRANLADHKAYLADRSRRREVVAAQAGLRAFEAARRDDHMRAFVGPDGPSGPMLQGSSGHARAQYRRAHEEAGQRFDAKEPPLDFGSWKKREKRG
jgi:hypothetical protein